MEWFISSPYNPKIDKVPIIYDTTLRDGEQTPGVSFSPREKLEISIKLDQLGVNEIEAGFPIVSSGEFEAVKSISQEGLNAKIFALSRASIPDVERALDADVEGVSLFTSTSPMHLKYKMKKSRNEVINDAMDALEYAKDHGLFISFSNEDATRTPLKELFDLYHKAEETGADRVHVSDTVGVATPEAYRYIISFLRKTLKEKTQIGVHAHNDFGLATSNSLAGLMAGADMVSVTVNGIGERAGNASLQELAMALEVLYGSTGSIKKSMLMEISLLVKQYSFIDIPENKPLIGKNAFRHESGVHVDAVLKNPLTYEPFLPQVIGQRREIVLGKHSGKSTIKRKLLEMGLVEKKPENLLHRIKDICDNGNRITDDEFIDLAEKC